MRILVVNDILQGGGVEKLMYDLVMHLRKEHEIAILTDHMDPEFDKVYPSDVKYFYQMVKEYPKGRNRLERKMIYRRKKRTEENLKKSIREMDFDVLLCMKESWIMSMAIQYGGDIPKRIAWVHTDYFKSYYTKKWFPSDEEVRLMQRYHHVVCVSQVIINSIKETIGDPGNLVCCYNPLNVKEIQEKSLEAVEDIQKNDKLLFVTVGRLNYQKGYDILLEVCNLLNQQGYQECYDVWIVGGGESSDGYEVQRDLEERIFRYHLDNVYLLGHRSNPYKYIRQGDWFLSSSRYEGFSFVSQEAAIIGKPLMLTECAGVMELIQSKDKGVVMENSYAGIYFAMKQAIENPCMAQEYAGRMDIPDAYSYGEERIRQIEKLFME